MKQSDSFQERKKAFQDMQDEIFRKMPAEKKLKLLDSFYRFAKTLKATPYGSYPSSQKNSQNFRKN